jgi:hypothetical protein
VALVSNFQPALLLLECPFPILTKEAGRTAIVRTPGVSNYTVSVLPVGSTARTVTAITATTTWSMSL